LRWRSPGELIAQKAEGCFCHRKTLVARMIRPADLLPLWVMNVDFDQPTLVCFTPDCVAKLFSALKRGTLF
jgi:hypothetical protein